MVATMPCIVCDASSSIFSRLHDLFTEAILILRSFVAFEKGHNVYKLIPRPVELRDKTRCLFSIRQLRSSLSLGMFQQSLRRLALAGLCYTG
jgi:hypothetical protein